MLLPCPQGPPAARKSGESKHARICCCAGRPRACGGNCGIIHEWRAQPKIRRTGRTLGCAPVAFMRGESSPRAGPSSTSASGPPPTRGFPNIPACLSLHVPATRQRARNRAIRCHLEADRRGSLKKIRVNGSIGGGKWQITASAAAAESDGPRPGSRNRSRGAWARAPLSPWAK